MLMLGLACLWQYCGVHINIPGIGDPGSASIPQIKRPGLQAPSQQQQQPPLIALTFEDKL